MTIKISLYLEGFALGLNAFQNLKTLLRNKYEVQETQKNFQLFSQCHTEYEHSDTVVCHFTQIALNSNILLPSHTANYFPSYFRFNMRQFSQYYKNDIPSYVMSTFLLVIQIIMNTKYFCLYFYCLPYYYQTINYRFLQYNQTTNKERQWCHDTTFLYCGCFFK